LFFTNIATGRPGTPDSISSIGSSASHRQQQVAQQQMKQQVPNLQQPQQQQGL